MIKISKKFKKILTKGFLIKEYLRNKKSTLQIAKERSCGVNTVNRYLKKNNIKIRTLNEASHSGNSCHKYIDGRCLKNYYCIGCGKGISLTCGIYGFEKCKSCTKKGKIGNRFIDGRKTAKYHCLKCEAKITYPTWFKGSKTCQSCSNKGKNNPMFGKIASHGKGSYYQKTYMRSSYEIAYAKWLDKQKIKWNYEPQAFPIQYNYKGKKKEGTYRPDFYLPTLDLWIEIKGWWRDDAKVKFKAFKRIYPGIEIKVLGKKELKSILN